MVRLFYVCCVLNGVPLKGLDKNPCELRKGYSPNLNFLRVWVVLLVVWFYATVILHCFLSAVHLPLLLPQSLVVTPLGPMLPLLKTHRMPERLEVEN